MKKRIVVGENNFLEEIRNRNEDALCYAIERYAGLVMSVIRKHLYILEEEQKECFDDVFINVWEHINSFDEEKSTFTNWIAGIARYRSIDYLRRCKKQFSEVPLEDSLAEEDERLLSLMDMEISEETELMLQNLKPEDRDLFQKLFVEEMTIGEVCRSLQTNPNVIYKRLSRARKRMRELFPDHVERKEDAI